MTNPWDLLSAGFWLVFLVWVVAVRLVLAGLDEPDPDGSSA
ncbi:MAG TPA: hypothetical protein VIC62_19105 [Nakamurella sp.]